MKLFQKLSDYAGRIFSTAYGGTIVAFFAIQLSFLLAHDGPAFAWLVRKGDDFAIAAILMLSIHLLVVANTVIYIFDAQESYGSVIKDGGRVRFRVAIGLLIAAVVVSVAMAVSVSLFAWDMFNRETVFWWHFLEINEPAVILVFLCFVVADYLLVQQLEARVSLANADDLKAQLRANRNKARLFLIACDVPGFIGLVLIAMISHVMKEKWSPGFWSGFSAGATALHIVFSQIVLTLVEASGEERGG